VNLPPTSTRPPSLPRAPPRTIAPSCLLASRSPGPTLPSRRYRPHGSILPHRTSPSLPSTRRLHSRIATVPRPPPTPPPPLALLLHRRRPPPPSTSCVPPHNPRPKFRHHLHQSASSSSPPRGECMAAGRRAWVEGSDSGDHRRRCLGFKRALCGSKARASTPAAPFHSGGAPLHESPG
jgi:hypothetical protein